jgi:pimeloyl-ACP methyl ester carboxylesterase
MGRTGRTLHHATVTVPGKRPGRWLYLAHGIFGAGRNWRAVARRVVERCPAWGAVLLDLRHHGESTGFPPPDTIAACAADIARLEEMTGRPASAILGHSFGGKVALEYAATAPPSLAQAWIVDSTLSSGEPRGDAVQMLRTLRGLPCTFADRAAAVEALEASGFDPSVAGWMSTNLEPSGNGLRWRFDLDALSSLLHDFFETDSWSVVEAAGGPELHFVAATESGILTGPELARLERAERQGRVRLYHVRGGHWLNAENPSALVDLIVATLP